MKKRIFGIIAAIVLVMTMVGSAAVVSYLTNPVEVKATVDGPLEMKIGKTNGNWASNDKIAFSVYGGETIDFWIYLKNKASEPIDVDGTQFHYVYCPQKFDINSGGAITKAEFDKIEARTWSSLYGWDPATYNLLDVMTKVDNKHVKVQYGPVGGFTLGANEIQKIHVTVDFDPHCVGTYVLTSQLI